MVRDALRDRFIDALSRKGGSAGNGWLLGDLGWKEDTYAGVRAALMAEGVVALGRGRGGAGRFV